jgi:hypothetical protein
MLFNNIFYQTYYENNSNDELYKRRASSNVGPVVIGSNKLAYMSYKAFMKRKQESTNKTYFFHFQ